jgi:hypothetical protein
MNEPLTSPISQALAERLRKLGLEGSLTLSITNASRVLEYGYDFTNGLVKSDRLKSVPAGKKRRRVPVVAIDEYIATEMVGGTNASTSAPRS